MKGRNEHSGGCAAAALATQGQTTKHQAHQHQPIGTERGDACRRSHHRCPDLHISRYGATAGIRQRGARPHRDDGSARARRSQHDRPTRSAESQRSKNRQVGTRRQDDGGRGGCGADQREIFHDDVSTQLKNRTRRTAVRQDHAAGSQIQRDGARKVPADVQLPPCPSDRSP